jgi:two-component system NtrC family sensor kinase
VRAACVAGSGVPADGGPSARAEGDAELIATETANAAEEHRIRIDSRDIGREPMHGPHHQAAARKHGVMRAARRVRQGNFPSDWEFFPIRRATSLEFARETTECDPWSTHCSAQRDMDVASLPLHVRTLRPAPVAARAKTPPVLVWMLFAIATVAAIAYWDAARESDAALRDFAREQTTLASGASVALRAGLPTPEITPFDPVALLAALKPIEQPGSILLLVQRPTVLGLLTTDGRVVRSTAIERALERGTPWVRLARDDASPLGLPARTAVAGIARVDAPGLTAWRVVVVASAERERDRELRAQWRLVLGVLLASGLVFAFGGMALRKQRKELELSRELAIAEIREERDERLVRADKLATMGALATGIAHEVSTPLGVIMGRAEQLMPRLEGDERSRRALEVISEQAARIGRVIRAFLSLARGDAPLMEHAEPTALARTSLELVEHRFTRAGVALRSDIAEGLPRIACEPRLFEQVLVNLLLNACDACAPGGSVELSVRADSERVAFVVTDDGTGIPSDVAARAIEPFFTTKSAGQGTGLGLAIANEIVKHHCGTLSLTSRAAVEGSRDMGTRACVEIAAVHRG